jgi:diguanylate cyclase
MLLLPAHVARSSPASLSFAVRAHRLRTLGLGLGALAVAGVFHQNGASWQIWALLLFNGFVWPHLARLISSYSDDPQQSEVRNLFVDSAMGGAWVVLMQFNLLTSVLLLSMLAIDKISVGGWRFLLRSMAVGVAAGAVVLAACVASGDWVIWRLDSTMPAILSALPMLAIYPMVISTSTHALAKRVRRQNRELERRAAIDPATGLLNRPSWERAVARELALAQRHGRPAALLMIDIDRFKDINDGYGHPAGDEVIRATARVIKSCIRDGDVACRYGGDEFGVLLTNAGVQAALATAELARARVAATVFAGRSLLNCTLSVGVAVAAADLPDARTWIERTDAALYRAKTAGRDRVWRAGDDAPGPGLSSL